MFDVSFVGDTLSFSIQRQQGPTPLSFKLDGETLTGNLPTLQGDLPIVSKKSA
ncbi:MAG: hypothetical protein ACJAS2_001762 [Pseudohongiellaceae bacterium]|jgi:hypothetical protein